MGSFIFSAIVAGGIVITGLGLDMGLNATQNWYDTVYRDAFWSTQVADTDTMRALAREEVEIARQLDQPEFVLPPAAKTAAPGVVPRVR